MEIAEKVAVILAVLLLLVGAASSFHLQQIQKENEPLLEGDIITVNGKDMSMVKLFEACTQREVETVKGNYTGVPLACLINESGVAEPETHDYTIRAADGYEKTVQWDDMLNGIITEDRYTVFPTLPRAYWIHDVVEIEVK